MANESNGKAEVVQKTLKVYKHVAAAITRCHEADIAQGHGTSEADILRRIVVAGLASLGFPVEAPIREASEIEAK